MRLCTKDEFSQHDLLTATTVRVAFSLEGQTHIIDGTAAQVSGIWKVEGAHTIE